jgi:parallel beta-helix repeat protein
MNTKILSVKMAIRVLLVGIILLSAFGMHPPSQAQASPAGTYIVDTLTDGHDSNVSDGICDNGVDGCGLRAAIEQARELSWSGDPYTITFWSGLAGSTFHLDGTLGTIQWYGEYIELNGGDNNLTISGDTLAAGQNIFDIGGNNNWVHNLVVRDSPSDGIEVKDFLNMGFGNYNEISDMRFVGNDSAGVTIMGGLSGGIGNSIHNVLFGALDSATSSCTAGEENTYGIYIQEAYTTTVVLSDVDCSTSHGIYNYTSTHTIVQSSNIGVGVNGTLGNGGAGIYDFASVSSDIKDNKIGGNAMAGIWLQGSNLANIHGNVIGLNYAGDNAAPNAYEGIAITDGASGNVVGGSIAADGNVIAGNRTAGVLLRDGATLNFIQYNLIGTSLSLIAPNLLGILIRNADNNFIGSSNPSETQTIAFNSMEGIYVWHSNSTIIGESNQVNYNGQEGIRLVGSSNSSIRASSVINNGWTGIAVQDEPSFPATGNLIDVPVNHNNVSLPIDLGNDGHTPNFSHLLPGPNNWLPYPAILSTNGNVIHGITCSACNVVIYRNTGDPSAQGGGVDMKITTITTDSEGYWSIDLTGYGVTPTQIALLTVDPATGDTSEFAPLKWFYMFLPMTSKQ